jgi:hypothetical protein
MILTDVARRCLLMQISTRMKEMFLQLEPFRHHHLADTTLDHTWALRHDLYTCLLPVMGGNPPHHQVNNHILSLRFDTRPVPGELH